MLMLLWQDLLPVFTAGHWPLLTSPSSDAYHPLWAPLLVFELLGNLAFIGFSIIALLLFFRRSPQFPKVMVAYYVASLVFVAADFFLANLIPAVAAEADAEGVRELIRSIVTCAVWVPYMYRSQRVMNTFIELPSPPLGPPGRPLPTA
jgi:hypothetical protein